MPSTYTGWSAFYGKRPLYYIEKASGEVQFRGFGGGACDA